MAVSGPQVPFEDEAFAADHKAHDSGLAILHGNRENGKTAGHFSVHDVAPFSARCVVALSAKYSQGVPVDDKRLIW